MKHIYQQVPLLLGLVLITTINLKAQNFKDKFSAQATTASVRAGSSTGDNPVARQQFNMMRLVDPETGQIPANIKMLEKEFAKKLKAPNIGFAPAGGGEVSQWIHRGPFNVGGRTRGIGFDVRNEDILIAGGVSGGIFRSTDFGNSWVRVTPGNEHPSVTDIVQDTRPGNEDTWYYATGEFSGNSASGGGALFEGNGIYKSINNGLSWEVLPVTVNNDPQTNNPNNPFERVHELSIDLNNGNLYAATENGIWRSLDGGATFEEVLDANEGTWSYVEVTPSGVVYAAVQASPTGGGIFRSTDGSAGSYVNITPPDFSPVFGRITLGVAPSNENVMYALASGTVSTFGHDFFKYTYVSGDGSGVGGIWENRSNNLPNYNSGGGTLNTQGGYDQFVEVYPTDENIVFIAGTDLYRSFDGFATQPDPNEFSGWIGGYNINVRRGLVNINVGSEFLYPNHHPDCHRLIFLNSDPRQVISTTDGGIAHTIDILSDVSVADGVESVEWIDLNRGYKTLQSYAISLGPDGQILTGNQDQSTWFLPAGTNNDIWTDVSFADGSYSGFSEDGLTRYMSWQNGTLIRRTYPDANSTAFITNATLTPAATGVLFINPLELDPNNRDIMYYAGGTTLWRNDDLPNATTSTGWTALTNAQAGGGQISAIGISQNPANVVYFGTTTGEIWRIDNAHVGNPTATDVFSGKGLPGGYVSSIAIDPNNPNRVFVVFSNYNIPSIFSTLDGGSTWTDISGNLEEFPNGSGAGPSVQWISVLGNNDFYMVGTSVGAYRTDNILGSSTEWSRIEDIPTVPVTNIRSNPDGLVAVGTHGNGIFTANFTFSEPNVSLAINETPANVEVDKNSPDVLVDLSNVFTSTEPITLFVTNNTNPSLVETSLDIDQLTLSFTPDADGVAAITITAAVPSGENLSIDLAATVIGDPPVITDFPFTESFTSFSLPDGWSASGSFPWLLNIGGTPSVNTGPLSDRSGDPAGIYVYTEASGLTQGVTGTLSTAELVINGLTNPILEFYYHMFALDGNMGNLEVHVLELAPDKSVTNDVTLLTISGVQQSAQSDDYLRATVNLSSYIGQSIKIAFVGVRGSSFQGDIAVDDISVIEADNLDVGISQIVGLSGTIAQNSATDVVIDVFNSGSQDVVNPTVSYTVDGGTPVVEVIPQTILAGSSLQYTFTQTADLSSLGTRVISANIDLAGDQLPTNNTATTTVTVSELVSSFPYAESFEGSNTWSQDGSNVFQLGTPSAVIINSASDGANAWVTNLTGSYPDNATAFVLSPIFDLSGLAQPTIVLDIWYEIETDWDGALVQSSIDGGQSWQTVGALGDPVNWYNSNVILANGSTALNGLSSNGDAWSGDLGNGSNGWITAIHDLNQVLGQSSVQLRVAFGSDGAVTNEGFAFDNVRIIDGISDVTITSVSPATGFSNFTGLSDIEVTVANQGNNDLTGIDVSYQVDGGTVVTETIANLAAFTSTVYTFSTQADFTAPGQYTLEASVSIPSDDLPDNNTLVNTIFSQSLVSSFPYTESFESGAAGWVTDGDNDSWALGVPSGAIINSASDGSQAWVTNLAGNYPNNQNSAIYSPFFDLSLQPNSVLFLDLWTETESGFDGATVEISSDGSNWSALGTVGDDTNWFDSTFGNTSGWSGSSGSFFTASRDLGSSGTVILRVRFSSDVSTVSEGVAIDNIRILDASTLVGITCPANIVADTDPGEGTATVSVPAPTITNGSGSEVITNSFNNTADASGVYPVGETVVTWFVTDNNYTASCTMKVTVNDVLPPTLSCNNDIEVGINAGETSAVVNYNFPTVSDNASLDIEVNESPGAAVDGSWNTCSAGGIHVNNGYYKLFDMAGNFGIDAEFSVSSVEFGVGAAISGNPSGVQPIFVRLYTMIDPAGPLDLFTNFNLIAQTQISLPDSPLGTIIEVPLTAEIPAGALVLMEVFSPDAFFTNLNHSFGMGYHLFIGDANLSFVTADNCSRQPNRLDTTGATIGPITWVMNLNGVAAPALVSGLASGSDFPIGTTTQVFEVADASGNLSNCSFDVTVSVASLDAPVAAAATDITNNSFTANWDPVVGASEYLLDISIDNFLTFLPNSQAISVSGPSFSVTGLSPGATYQYRVLAKNALGVSLFSNTVIQGTFADPPVATTATNVTDQSFEANWETGEGILIYELDVSSDGFATYVPGFNSKIVSSGKQLVTGLNPGTDYEYRVRAVNTLGVSANSNIVAVTTLPASTNGLVASNIAEDSFTLSWDALPDATTYLIDVSADNFASFVGDFNDKPTANTSIDVTGLVSDTEYEARISVIFNDGTVSVESHPIWVRTLLGAPIANAATEISDNSFRANWEKVRTVNDYAVEVTEDNFATSETFLVTGISSIILDRDGNTDYSYRVKSLKDGNESAFSNVIDVLTIPSVPENVATSNIAFNFFDVTWEGSASEFLVEVSEAADFSSFIPGFDGAVTTDNGIQVTGLDESTTYFARVKGQNASGESDYSNVVSATTGSEASCYPASVVEFKQGRTKYGFRVPRHRSDPDKALGAPQENDSFNFVSLGFGGSITFELAEPLYDDGSYDPDFIIVETSFGRADEMCIDDQDRNYPESAFIEVSQDGDNWFSLPNIYCRTSFVDISPAVEEGLQFANFIRITDASNRLWFRFFADGYDIDGLILCPSEVKSAFDRLVNARELADNTVIDWDFFNNAPNEEGEHAAIALYPNPIVEGEDIQIATFSPQVDDALIQVYDLQGLLVIEQQMELVEGNNQLNVPQDLLQGIYLLKYTSGSFSETLKFSKE